MSDYSKAVIYIITTGDDFYVGSTSNFNKRREKHKNAIHNKNDRHSNYYLYKKIRENNSEWNMEIYKHFPCENNEQLIIEEQKNMNELKPTLNERKAYRTEQDKKDYCASFHKINQRKYYEKNKKELRTKASEEITCECGCKVTRRHIAEHRKRPKHIKLMEQII